MTFDIPILQWLRKEKAKSLSFLLCISINCSWNNFFRTSCREISKVLKGHITKFNKKVLPEEQHKPKVEIQLAIEVQPIINDIGTTKNGISDLTNIINTLIQCVDNSQGVKTDPPLIDV